MDDLARSGCLNPDRKDSGRRRGHDLRAHSRCGARKRYRIRECRTGGGRASERKGAPLDRSHPPEETAVSIL
jgi:hypothetical protein